MCLITRARNHASRCCFHPVGTSVATTNVNDRLIIAGNAIFSRMGAPYGQAEGGSHQPAGIGVVSGIDPSKNGRTYVNQIFVGYSAGGANHGHDGWLTYCGPANGGLIQLDSIEVDESMYPIVIEERGIVKDSQGIGEFEGAPAAYGVFRPVGHDMTLVYAADGTTFVPRGVLGGGDGTGSTSVRLDPDGSRIDLPAIAEEVIPDGSKVYFTACGGAGYGDPSKRDPKRVAASVNRGWMSRQRAEAAYDVVLVDGDQPGLVKVDHDATVRIRASR